MRFTDEREGEGMLGERGKEGKCIASGANDLLF